MNKQPTSAPCRLQLVPAAKVVRYAILHNEAIIQYYSADLIDVQITPGTLKLSDQPADEAITYTKKHTFRVPSSGLEQQRKLDELAHTPLVALYLDEHGRQKVSGSPNYPLQLSVTPSGGTYSCTLGGITNSMDLFVAQEI